MEPVSKKYFSISEVAEMTGIPQYKLRYLEKSTTKMKVSQIRGRRYYTAADIESIKQKLGVANTASSFSQVKNFSNIITQIDSLIAKFVELETRSESNLI